MDASTAAPPAPPGQPAPPAAAGVPTLPFARHHAYLVGIDAYEHVSPLRTAVADARRLAAVLGEMQHFLVHPPLLDASAAGLRTLLAGMAAEVSADDRVLFYFAGHGIAADGDDGPAGYLVPADADPTRVRTFVPMAELQDALQALPCRHLLLILDCCFSGAFKWSSQSRAIGTLMPKRLYRERYDRFVTDPAWQVLTSAAHDQKALDVLQGGRATGDRGQVDSPGAPTGTDPEAHSPFAAALFDGLAGAADARTDDHQGDGVITATELYAYIRDRVEPQTLAEGQRLRQTPGFFPLRKHDKGEFIFLHPKHRLNLPPIPSQSPFKGLASFDEADRLLFYGRERVVRELQAQCANCRLVVVSGASGTGKSSVVKAGLLPLLRAAGHPILPVMRPGAHPMAALQQALAGLPAVADDAAPTARAVLVIDQFEEIITRCADDAERQAFMARLHEVLTRHPGLHRLLLTVRADYEPQIQAGALREAWRAGRCTVPPFSLEELKEVVLMPTLQAVLIFEPPELVDTIVGDVVQSPGALPLLSYALSELYEAYRSSGRADRALTQADYERLGGVMGALRTKADALYQALTPPQQSTMRKLVLRMVSAEGDLASRRVAIDDLDYSPEENPRVTEVIERLVDARLVVRGADYIEPAHDALVRAWRTLHEWIHAVGRDRLILGARLDPEADEFARSGDVSLLWNDNPNLAVASAALKAADHGFNAKEVSFIRRSVARNLRRTRLLRASAAVAITGLLALSGWAMVERNSATRQAAVAQTQATVAQNEKLRSVRSLFASLSLSMNEGQPGSVCVHGECPQAPPGDGGAWFSLGQLPESMPSYDGSPLQSTVFIAARDYGEGHVLIYAHDGLTVDSEIGPGSDNLLFAENALRWLSPLAEESANCPAQTTVVLWQGSFVKAGHMRQVLASIARRGWALKLSSWGSLAADLQCAEVLWYLSDWRAPPDFATVHVPLIEAFVRRGGGLLVGGLGWSFAQQGGGGPYAADQLGQPFGFAFTTDAFASDRSKPITLMSGR